MPTPHEARRRHSVPQLSLGDTRLSTWEERDRAHVELINVKNDSTIIEWWDDDVRQAVEDGFLKPGKMHQTAYEYAVHVGLIQRPGPRPAMYHSPRGEAAKENPVRVSGQRIGSRVEALRHAKREARVDAWIVESGGSRGDAFDIYTRGPKNNFKFNRYFEVDGVWYLSDMTMFAKALPAGANSLREVRENPVEARDFDSIDDALAKAPEFLGAEWFVRSGDKVTAYANLEGVWYEAKLVKARGLYHWPSEWGARVKGLPKGAQPFSKLDPIRGPGGTSRECGCEHGCAQENPVEDTLRIDEHGIPWVVVERDPKAQAQKLEVQNRVGTIKGAREVYDLLDPWASRQNKENLLAVLLDIHSELRGVALIHVGQRDRVSVDPQDVMKPVINEGAKGLILVHNHPTGRADHSSADASLTKEMAKACDTNGIKFVDHVVMGTNEYYSFADKKLTKVKKKKG